MRPSTLGRVPIQFKEWAKELAPKGACRACILEMAWWLENPERSHDIERHCARCGAKWSPFRICLEAVKRHWISPDGWTQIKPEDFL